MPPAPAPAPRVLACLLCQQRKVKCNRQSPCQHCARQGVACVAAPPTPRRSRRRFPERELLARVRTYEALLRQHHVAFDSLFQTVGPEGPDGPDGGPADGSQTEDEPSADDTPDATTNFWRAINQGFAPGPPPDDIPQDNTSTSTTSTSTTTTTPVQRAIRAVWDTIPAPLSHAFLAAADTPTAVALTARHPPPATLFRLWQIYLDRVDPLLKVTHTPSLQGRIVEAANMLDTLGRTDAALEAFLFGMYCSAMHALSAAECAALWGSQAGLLRQYQAACAQALVNCDFLRTDDRHSLVALFLYLTSLTGTTDPASLYALTGLAIRIGQRLQMHTERPPDAVTPLEAELRRRLWWAMVLLDARVAELADHRPAALDPTWTCRVPCNVHDADLRPDMKELPPARDRPTESIFAVVRAQLGDVQRHAPYYLDLTTPALRAVAKEAEKGKAKEDQQDKKDRLAADKDKDSQASSPLDPLLPLRHCDPDNPLHVMALQTARGLQAKSRLFAYFARFSRTAPPPAAQRDAARADALAILDSDTLIWTSPRTAGFAWIMALYFPFPAYIHLTQDLVQRSPGGPDGLDGPDGPDHRAATAWDAMNANYDARLAGRGLKTRRAHDVLSRFILQAWERYAAACRDAAVPPVAVPPMIRKIQERLQDQEPSSPEPTALASTAPASYPLDGLQTMSLEAHPGFLYGMVPGTAATGLFQPLEMSMDTLEYPAPNGPPAWPWGGW